MITEVLWRCPVCGLIMTEDQSKNYRGCPVVTSNGETETHLHLAQHEPINFNYLALIQGGEGPDCWDEELKIWAADFRDASNQAIAKADELGGQCVSLEAHYFDLRTMLEKAP